MAVNRNALPEGLLSDVKNYLQIPWEDASTDARMSGIIAAGMVYVNDKYGAEVDYTADSFARTLLLEYCRYARDAALDVFENNYTALILAMQNNKGVEDYVESSAQAG